MKYIGKIIVLMMVSLFAFGVNALNIEITNVELSNKTEYVEEVSSPTIDGTNINLNIRFKDEEQKIVYKIDLKNNTKSDVVLDTSFDNNIIKYTLKDFEGNSIKANSTRTIYLELYYKDEIDESLYSNKLYTASSTFKFMLSGQNGLVKGVLDNPKTGVFTYSFLVLTLIGVFSAIFMFSKRKNVFKHFVIAFLLIVPTFVIADTVFNTTVDGTTTMEFIEPKRAILDVGETVNLKMHEMAGHTMPGWINVPCGSSTCQRYDDGDTSHIKHFVRAESLNSNNAQEVQAEDSDYKIWMWFDTDTIYYYSDEALIYFNPNSSKFFYYLSGLEEFDSLHYFHAKYLKDASYMFQYACGGVQGDFDLKLNMKTKNVENMNYMFFRFRQGANGNSNSSFELGDLFTLDNCTNAYGMFSEAFYGVSGNTGNLSFKLNDVFNASKVMEAGRMFAYFGYNWKNISVDLGDNFNLSATKDITDFFYTSFSNVTGDIHIDCGDNFNAKSVENAYATFYGVARNGSPTGIYIDMGKNFNLESVTYLVSFVRCIGESMNGGIVDIDFGDNFNASGVITGTNEFLYGTGIHADKININCGKNFNIENCNELRGMFYNFGYYAKEVNIDLGENFNCKRTTRLYEFINSFCQYLPSDGVVNIDFGDNFNAESVDYIYELVSRIGSYNGSNNNTPNLGTVNIDLGDNFNSHNVNEVQQLFYDIRVNNLNINIGDDFTINNASIVKYLFYNLSATNSFKVDLGSMNFNLENANTVKYLFYMFGENSNVQIDNLSSISCPNATEVSGLVSLFAQNGTIANDLIIDLSGFSINSTDIQYDDVYDPEDPSWMTVYGFHLMYDLNPNIKIKVHNNNIGTSGRTLKQLILRDNENLTDSNFIVA